MAAPPKADDVVSSHEGVDDGRRRRVVAVILEAEDDAHPHVIRNGADRLPRLSSDAPGTDRIRRNFARAPNSLMRRGAQEPTRRGLGTKTDLAGQREADREAADAV